MKGGGLRWKTLDNLTWESGSKSPQLSGYGQGHKGLEEKHPAAENLQFWGSKYSCFYEFLDWFL